jgi:hypothetical protein
MMSRLAHDWPMRRRMSDQMSDLVSTVSESYSVLLCTLGSANQHAIIAAYMPKQTGCSTHVPVACARRPVVKGATAPPELPAPPMKPMAVV